MIFKSIQILSLHIAKKLLRPTHIMSQHGLDDNIVLFLQMETWGREIMAFPVVEFSRQGYKIRKVFG